MPVLNRLADLHDELTAFRRDLHMHPELGYEEHRTAGRIAAALRAMGCDEVVEGVGGTGVVGVIRGISKGAGRTIGLRADMDALPIREITGKPWASTSPGKMHACGHDGHVTMLLGAARCLVETRRFAGTVALIFQPAEEGGGGARAMVQDGLMERFGIDEVYGLHNMPGIPAGVFAMREGPIMAAADHFTITVTGHGGHAAKPQICVDAGLVAAQIMLSAQTLVSRNTDPLDAAVVTVSSFHTDVDTFNIIPQTAVLKGTVRTLKPAVQDMLEARLGVLARRTAEAFGATADVFYKRNYPVTVSAEGGIARAREAALSVNGEAGVIMGVDPMMGAEDFSFMLNERPGAYIFLGAGDGPGVHHPAYDFNDAIIPAGSSWFVRIAETAMPLD